MMSPHQGVMDEWLNISADAPRGRKLERMLLESAREHLGDAPVRVVLRGQTHVSPLVLPLVAPVLLFFLVKARSVIVTDRSIITVQESIWLQAKVTRVVSQYPRGGVAIRRTRLGLKVGNDPTVYAMPGSLGALKDTASAGSRPATMNGASIRPTHF
jgi:hypothetical protein